MKKEIKVKQMPDLDKVYKVYSGKVGCMCGCNGTWKATAEFVNFANKEQGYCYSDDQISNRSVKIIYNKIKRNMEAGEDIISNIQTEGSNTNYLYWDDGRRCLAIYFKTK